MPTLQMKGDLTALPQSAPDRFARFHDNIWLGLYNLDLLNAVNQIIFLLPFFALCAAGESLLAQGAHGSPGIFFGF